MSPAEFYWRVQMFDDDGIPGPSVDGQIAEQGPLLAIAAASAVKDEGNSGVTEFTFNVTRSGDIAGTTTANCNVTGYEPNPADGADFVGGLLPSVSVSFAPNETSAECTIGVLGDTNAEPDESFQVMLTNLSEGAQIISGPAIGTIRNDDGAQQGPLLAIAADAAAKIEGNSDVTEFTFYVTRGGIITGTTTANCSVTGNEPNPADGADFVDGVLPVVPITFAPNETSAQCTIRVRGDTSVEADESFQVILTNVSDGAQITSGPATGTILNDDSTPGTTSTIYLPQVSK